MQHLDDMGLVFQFQVGDIKITYLKPSAWSGLLPSLAPMLHIYEVTTHFLKLGDRVVHCPRVHHGEFWAYSGGWC